MAWLRGFPSRWTRGERSPHGRGEAGELRPPGGVFTSAAGLESGRDGGGSAGVALVPEVGLGRRSGGRDGRRLNRVAEVGADPLQLGRAQDESQHLASATATGAFQNVLPEHTLQQLSPPKSSCSDARGVRNGVDGLRVRRLRSGGLAGGRLGFALRPAGAAPARQQAGQVLVAIVGVRRHRRLEARQHLGSPRGV